MSAESENSESTPKVYAVEFSPAAAREVKKLQKTLEKKLPARYLTRLPSFGTKPFPPNSEKLTGEDYHFRLRIADYRVIYVVDEVNFRIEITRIRHRKDVYKQ